MTCVSASDNQTDEVTLENNVNIINEENILTDDCSYLNTAIELNEELKLEKNYNDKIINKDNNILNENNDNTENLQINIEDSTPLNTPDDTWGKFTDLDSEIQNSENYLKLTRDYINDGSTDYSGGININKNITIDGNGHTLDANKKGRIFNVNAANVTFININFTNGFLEGRSGGAISFENAGTVINCTFINNFNYHNTGGGGAIFFKNDGGQVYNSTFISNIFRAGDYGGTGSAISFGSPMYHKDGIIENCTFINNQKYIQGSFVVYGNNLIIKNSLFINNTKISGSVSIENNGIIENCNFTNNDMAITGKNLTVINCNFNNNTASYNGAAISVQKRLIVEKSTFNNNKAGEKGGAIYSEGETTINNSTFINNSGGNGGAIFANNYTVIKNSTFIDNIATSGSSGAINFKINGTVLNSYFENNQADSYGGAIYFEAENKKNSTINNSQFYNNKAKTAGAIMNKGNLTIENSIFQGNIATNTPATKNIDNAPYANFITINTTPEDLFLGTFKELYDEIQNAENYLKLTRDYINDGTTDYSEGIIINKNITIDGNGHTLDANKKGRIFNVTAANVTFININFINGNSYGLSGGAIYATGKLTIEKSAFNNNQATEGGALFILNGEINNTQFTGNTADNGGAISVNGILNISNSKFEENTAIDTTNNVAIHKNGKVNLNNVTPEDLGPYYAGHMTINNVTTNVTYGESVKITVTVTDENNTKFNNGTVSIIINGETFSSEVVNGTATIEIPKADAGNYKTNVFYNGNGYVASSSVEFNVAKQNATITAANKAYIINYGGKYSITLKDPKGNALSGEKVTFTLNGKTIGTAVTNTNGVATITFTANILKTAKAGTKNLVVKLTNNNYNCAPETVKITINKEKIKINAKKKTFKKAKKVKKYKITLKNSKGKAVKKVKVTLKIKNKKYTAKTNKKGKAIFKIKKLNKKGNYKGKITFKGNNYFKKATKKVTIKIK